MSVIAGQFLNYGAISLVGRARLDLSDEKRTQNDIEAIFKQNGIQYAREVRLNSSDIVDFMIGGIALEVKLQGARKKDVYKQLCRYAKHESVKALVLATNLTMGLPNQMEGKPVHFLALGRAWL